MLDAPPCLPKWGAGRPTIALPLHVCICLLHQSFILTSLFDTYIYALILAIYLSLIIFIYFIVVDLLADIAWSITTRLCLVARLLFLFWNSNHHFRCLYCHIAKWLARHMLCHRLEARHHTKQLKPKHLKHKSPTHLYTSHIHS